MSLKVHQRESNYIQPSEALYFIDDFGNSKELPKYHKDWNNLIEVCKKCRDETNDTLGIGNYQSKLGECWNDILRSLTTLDIEEVYLAVVKFVNYYNTQSVSDK